MLTWFMDPIHWFGEGGIFPLLAQHISYSAVALAIAFIIAFPVGCYTGHTGKGEGLLIGTTNALRSLPSFGLIILLVILLSGEFESDMAFILPCILVLVALALPPIALGVHAGIRALDPYVLDAARGMGMTQSAGCLPIPGRGGVALRASADPLRRAQRHVADYFHRHYRSLCLAGRIRTSDY